MFQIGFVNAPAVIGNAHFYEIADPHGLIPPDRIDESAVVGGDADYAVVLNGLESITDQVQENLVDMLSRTAAALKVRLQHGVNDDTRVGRQPFIMLDGTEVGVDLFVEVDDRRLGFSAPGHRDQIGNHCSRSFSRLLNFFYLIVIVVFLIHLHQQDVRIADHGGENIVEIMTNRAGHQAESFKFVCLGQFLLKGQLFLLISDPIADVSDHANLGRFAKIIHRPVSGLNWKSR